MKRIIRGRFILPAAIIFAIAVCLVMGQGCATSKAGSAYDVIYTAAVTYDTLMQFAAEQYVEGHMTEAQKNRVIELARKYYAAVLAAQSAFKVWKLAEIRGDQEGMTDAQEALAIAVDVMNEARDLFADFVYSTGPSGEA